MAKKYSFPEPGCGSCQHLQYAGNSVLGTRYCGGFPKKRAPRRFWASDPKIKAPKWCPKRISPPVCRVYGFADEQSRDLDYLTSRNFDHKHDQYIYPSPSRYKLRFETSLGINARTFYERVSPGDLDDFLMEADISLGEVVEIDDGLHPYFFYCLSWSRFVPAPTFDPSIAQK